ncbi:hypothetical protein OSB04_024533 [Centaurea solstitialis]|uniref:Retrotransposon gag domain-containing protein n=1 Tax=Centaurea solstitialis TaxID=347529 RepID=A0AA38SY03_9ASTR|nr:hypothetical protein OSB04_024533 [Centaurea solstitialis]
MIKELTFDGKSDSNPIVHVVSFEEICDLFKTEANRDAIRLRLFPFTLTGDAKAWLRSLEPSSIATWDDLRSKFLSRFFPPSKIEKLRADIRSFRQDEDETISEAWERFKHLLNSCPSHGFNKSLMQRVQGASPTKDCPNKPMMTPEEVNYINRGDYQGRWNNNRNFNQRPPGFFAPNQRTDGEPRASLEDRLFQFMETQKKLNEEVGRISQTLSGRTKGELPTQTQVNPKVEASKTVLMVDGVTTRKAWTDIYTKKYIPSDSEPDYATDYESDGITISFEHLGLRDPIYLSDEEELDSKQGGYAEFMIPKKSKGKEKVKEEDTDLIYVSPIKHDPGSYSLPFSVSNRFEGLALVDTGAALNMMPVSYCRKMKIKKLTPTTYQYWGINGYVTTPLGIAEAVPIRIRKFVYLTDFIVADLLKSTEISIILGRAFLHTAQANVDMCNQVTTLGYGDKRIAFNPDGKPVTHLPASYVDPSQCFKEMLTARYFHMSKRRKRKSTPIPKVRPRALIFEMGDKAPMWTAGRAAPTVPTNPITKPGLNKEIPGKLVHIIKDLTFDGKNDSNPIVHMENFVDICDLFKTEEGRDDAIRLRSKFLSRFFPPSKIDKLRADIRSFQQDDGETISEAWEHFRHLLNSCPSHGLTKSEQVQTFYSGLAYSSRATLDSSAGGVFMYKTPTEGYKLLEDMLIHNIDWRTDKRLQILRMAGKSSTDFDPSDELAAMKNQQVKFERKIEELIKSVHALQVGCEECNGPHLTKDCSNRPMMTPEEVNYINRGDYQGRWNNNRNFMLRPPGFFAPNQQNQRPDGEPRVSIKDRIVQFMDMQKKLNDEVSSYLCNHQSTIQNLELQVGRVSQMLSERTQGELPTQTQVNPKVENVKRMLMMTGEPSKKKWTDIYTKKYVESDSRSEPDYATDYDSEGFTISFEHLGLKGPVASSDDEEEDGKQGGYAEFMIPKKEDKGKEKEKEKAPEDDLIYIAPIKHDPGSYNLPISCHKFNGLALVDSGAALNMMPVGYCRKMGVKKIIPADYQYRGVNGYITKPLRIAEGVPIRIGNFVYYTDFVIANLPQYTEIPIILGRSFLHTAQVNTDMRN